MTNNGPDLANNISVTDNLSSSVTGVPLSFVSATTSAGTCGGVSTNAVVSCSLPSLQSGSTASIVIVVTPNGTSSGSQSSFNGGTVQAIGPGNIVFAQTSVPATMSDYSMSVGPANYSLVKAGDTAVYQVQLVPHPAYKGGISLSCSGQPANSSCNFTTSPVTLANASGATSTLNITTTARPVILPSFLLFSRHFLGMWLAVPGLLVLGAGTGSKRRRRRILGITSLCLMFMLLLLLPACSKSTTPALTGGTPPGVYTITVTATSGTDTKSAAVTLSVP